MSEDKQHYTYDINNFFNNIYKDGYVKFNDGIFNSLLNKKVNKNGDAFSDEYYSTRDDKLTESVEARAIKERDKALTAKKRAEEDAEVLRKKLQDLEDKFDQTPERQIVQLKNDLNNLRTMFEELKARHTTNLETTRANHAALSTTVDTCYRILMDVSAWRTAVTRNPIQNVNIDTAPPVVRQDTPDTRNLDTVL